MSTKQEIEKVQLELERVRVHVTLTEEEAEALLAATGSTTSELVESARGHVLYGLETYRSNRQWRERTLSGLRAQLEQEQAFLAVDQPVEKGQNIPCDAAASDRWHSYRCQAKAMVIRPGANTDDGQPMALCSSHRRAQSTHRYYSRKR